MRETIGQGLDTRETPGVWESDIGITIGLHKLPERPVCICVRAYVQQRAWLPATGLELQTHHCNHMNILVSKLAAKKINGREAEAEQRMGQCNVWPEKHSHSPIPNHQAAAPHPAEPGRGGCRQVTWQTSMHEAVKIPGHKEHILSLCKSCSPKTGEGARTWSRGGHIRAGLTWKTQVGAQALCSTALPRVTPCPQGTRETVTTCPVKPCDGKSGSSMSNFQVDHGVSQGCGVQQCFGFCLTGWCTATDLEPSFPPQLQMAHLPPDSGEEAGAALLTPLVVAAKQDGGDTGP